jgi:DNA-directed RNA polymerase specialized sigma24 family protein
LSKDRREIKNSTPILKGGTMPNNPPPNHDFANQLYRAIRKRVKRTRFSRRLIDNDEVVNEIFLRLSGKNLPPFDSDEFDNLLRRTTNHVVRDYRRFLKLATDIDEVNDDEHPFYEMDFFSVEEEFEFVFSKFCDSFDEPKRTVFTHSRTLSKESIAELTGLFRHEVARTIKSMPSEFKKFYRNFSENTIDR